MNSLHPLPYAVDLSEPDDFGAWRERVRALVQVGVRPEQVTWS